MSRDNPWTKHRQSFWQEKAGNPSLTLWQRVYALAYGVHRRNGHAPFKPGDIAIGTSVVDPHTGELRQPSASEVSRAIRTAVDYGFLHDSSCARCLVVPPWGIEGGMLGSPNEVCTLHSESKKRRRFDPQRQATLHSASTHNDLTCTDVESLYISSNRNLPTERDQAATPLHRKAKAS